MPRKIKLYPKTTRVGEEKPQITEKLNGETLGFFKLNGKLHIAQKKYVFTLEELFTDEHVYYTLDEFVKDNLADLEKINEGTIIFGEWLQMLDRDYPGLFKSKFVMFAKARILDNLEIYNYRYKVEDFGYAFENETVPDSIDKVPVIELPKHIKIHELDKLYDYYLDQVNHRMVEGFVITQNHIPQKYVRCKRGKIIPHFESN